MSPFLSPFCPIALSFCVLCDTQACHTVNFARAEITCRSLHTALPRLHDLKVGLVVLLLLLLTLRPIFFVYIGLELSTTKAISGQQDDWCR